MTKPRHTVEYKRCACPTLRSEHDTVMHAPVSMILDAGVGTVQCRCDRLGLEGDVEDETDHIHENDQSHKENNRAAERNSKITLNHAARWYKN